MSSIAAILAHSNLEEVSSNRFKLPKDVTLVKLGKAGTCFFNEKEYTNLAHGIINNYTKLTKPYQLIVGNGVKTVDNPLYEMGNLNPNTQEPNTLLSGVYRVPLPFERRTKNNQITFNNIAKIRKAKTNHSLVPLNNQKNTYTLKELVNILHRPGDKTTFLIYACQSFNEGERTVNSSGTVRTVSSYRVRYRRKNEPHRLVTKTISSGENVLRRQELNRYTSVLRNKLGYTKSNNANKFPEPGRFTIEVIPGRNMERSTQTRTMATTKQKLKEIKKLLKPPPPPTRQSARLLLLRRRGPRGTQNVADKKKHV